MRRTLALLCLSLALPGSALAEGITVRSLNELVRPAHVIARVTIVQERADRTRTRRTYYRRVALARVTDPIKGVARGQMILLYHDTVWLCPDVMYKRDDDLLLFATKVGRGYEAIWWTTGTMPVTGSRVTHDLFPRGTAYLDIRARVVRLLTPNDQSGSR